MMFVDETKKAINIALLKEKAPQTVGIGQIIGFYYKATLIPVILAVIVGLIFSGSSVIPILGALSVVGIVASWILAPIGFFIGAGIIHIFAKLFRLFKGNYSRTFGAVVYASFIGWLLDWLVRVPLLGIIVAIVVIIWGIVNAVVWIKRFQSVGNLVAIVSLVLPAIVIGIIVFALAAVFAFGVFNSVGGGGSGFSNICIASSGYVCQYPEYSSGFLTATIGQSTGVNWTNVNIAFVNSTSLAAFQSTGGFPSGSYVSIPNGLQNGAAAGVNEIPVGGSTMPGTLLSGQIWAEYEVVAGGPYYYTEIGTVTATET